MTDTQHAVNHPFIRLLWKQWSVWSQPCHTCQSRGTWEPKTDAVSSLLIWFLVCACRRYMDHTLIEIMQIRQGLIYLIIDVFFCLPYSICLSLSFFQSSVRWMCHLCFRLIRLLFESAFRSCGMCLIHFWNVFQFSSSYIDWVQNKNLARFRFQQLLLLHVGKVRDIESKVDVNEKECDNFDKAALLPTLLQISKWMIFFSAKCCMCGLVSSLLLPQQQTENFRVHYKSGGGAWIIIGCPFPSSFKFDHFMLLYWHVSLVTVFLVSLLRRLALLWHNDISWHLSVTCGFFSCFFFFLCSIVSVLNATQPLLFQVISLWSSLPVSGLA